MYLYLRDSVIDIDNFNRPKIIKDVEAYYTMLVRLILLNPGTIKTHPNMGVGLIRNWRFCDHEELPELERVIYNQISTYLPQLLVADVKIRYEDKTLVLEIILEKERIVLETSDFKELTLKDIYAQGGNI